jgi:hypothetical protein
MIKPQKEELEYFIQALVQSRHKDGTVIPDFDWKYGIKEFCATF